MKSWFSRHLLSAFLLLGFAFTSNSATYYVSDTGNDGNPGSSSFPFRQILQALSVAEPGDLIFVGDGSYNGFDITNVEGAPGSVLKIQATGSNATILPTNDRSDNRDTIHIQYSSYVEIDGLRSFNANRAAVRINASSHIAIRNCIFGNNTRWGIFTNHSDDITLEENECYGSQLEHGIYVSNSGDRPVLRGNVSHDNYGCGIHMNGDLSAGGDGIISGALIEKNIVYNNGVGGGSGINMDGVQSSVVKNNLVFNNHATGICAYRIDGAQGPKGMQFLHNTVDMASDGRWALKISQTQGTNMVRNNILFNRHSWRGGLCLGNQTDANRVDSDANILEWITTDDGGSRLSLSQWQASGNDLNSFTASLEVLWQNPATGDYHLLTDSPAVDSALMLNFVTDDLDDLNRPIGIAADIGCYESDASVTEPTLLPPSNLVVKLNYRTVVLTWNDNSSNENGFHVERSVRKRDGTYGAFNRITTLSPNTTKFKQTVNPGTYRYRIQSFISSPGEVSEYSNTIQIRVR